MTPSFPFDLHLAYVEAFSFAFVEKIRLGNPPALANAYAEGYAEGCIEGRISGFIVGAAAAFDDGRRAERERLRCLWETNASQGLEARLWLAAIALDGPDAETPEQPAQRTKSLIH